MARPKSKGAYAPLAAQYYLDDTILEAGPHAELMWVRILSFLASVPTDGFITDRQVRIVGNGLRDVNQRVEKLQLVGLLTAVAGGYEARSWQKWNRTTAEQNRIHAQDRERKARKAAGNGPNSDRKTTPFRPDSGDQYRTVENRTEQLTTLSSEVAIAPIRPDVEALLDLLDSEIQTNGGKKPTRTKKNTDAMRLMLDRDNHTAEQVAAAIRWCQNDEFWRANILSASKLREKYEQLRLAAQRKPGTRTAPTTKADQNAAEFHRLYGNGDNDERTRSFSAAHPGVG